MVRYLMDVERTCADHFDLVLCILYIIFLGGGFSMGYISNVFKRDIAKIALNPRNQTVSNESDLHRQNTENP